MCKYAVQTKLHFGVKKQHNVRAFVSPQAEKEAATQAASESRKQVIEAKEQLSPLRDRVIELEKGMQTLDLAKQQLAQMEVENSKLKEYTRVLEQREHSSNEYIQNIKQELDETKDCLVCFVSLPQNDLSDIV